MLGVTDSAASRQDIPSQTATKPGKKALGILFVVLIYLAAGFLLILPAVFLATGIQELGSILGLWAGDPNTNDGEESWATIAGVVSFAVVLTAAGLGSWPIAKWCGIRPLRTAVIAGGAVVLAFAVWLIPAFSGFRG